MGFGKVHEKHIIQKLQSKRKTHAEEAALPPLMCAAREMGARLSAEKYRHRRMCAAREFRQ